MVRQPCRHAHELRLGAKQGTRTVGIKRLHVHRPMPSCPHGLRQDLRVVLVGLVHPHLEGSTGMRRIKAGNVEPSAAQPRHKPRRHGTSLNTTLGILSRMPPYRTFDLPWVGCALAASRFGRSRRRRLPSVSTKRPNQQTGLLDSFHDANCRATRPGRGIMEDLCPRRDCPMSAYARRAARHCAPIQIQAFRQPQAHVQGEASRSSDGREGSIAPPSPASLLPGPRPYGSGSRR